MKKYLIILSAFAALVACSKVEKEEQPAVSQMTFNFTVNTQDETKAKTGWENGDVVFIFFKNIATKYIKLTRSDSGWTATTPGGDFGTGDFPSDKMLTAVHFPKFVGDVTVAYDDVTNKFTFKVDNESVYTYYMYASSTYTISGTIITSTITMLKPTGYVQFFVPMPAAELAEGHSYQLLESHITPKALASVTLNGTMNEASKTAGYALTGYAASNNGNNGMMFSGVLSSAGAPTAYTFSLVTNQSAAEPYALGTQKLSGTKTISSGVIFNLPNITSSWSTIAPYVDLGLSVKWATGWLTDNGTDDTPATSGSIVAPNAVGKYYSFAATTGYARKVDDKVDAPFTHAWNDSTTPYYNSESGTYTKYTTAATLATGASGDDAANKLLGSSWRLPTYAEATALVGLGFEEKIFDADKTYGSINVSYNTYSQLYGLLYTGTNGCKVWLMSLGYACDPSSTTYLGFNTVLNLRFWTASTDASGNPYRLYAKSGVSATSYRYFGFPLRPVYVGL